MKLIAVVCFKGQMIKMGRSGTDRNREDLMAYVNDVWENMRERQDITLALVNSLPNWMRCVVVNEGNPIDN